MRILEINCGEPYQNLTIFQQNFNSGSPPIDTVFGVSVIIKCVPGYSWADGSLTKTIQCQATSSWLFVASCVGNLNSLLFLHAAKRKNNKVMLFYIV